MQTYRLALIGFGNMGQGFVQILKEQGEMLARQFGASRAVTDLRCGGVMINDSTDYRIDSMPFGGVKGSGLGREGVQFAVQEMTEPKVVCITL